MREQNTKMSDLHCAMISHEGKCCRKTSASPASAEEYACIESTSLLLMGKNRNMLKNDEGIFATKTISNGCARGSQKFIIRQTVTISSASANKSKLMPGISYSIKHISN